MAERDIEDGILEVHFAAARRAGAELPAALTARMLADAARVQADQATPAPQRPTGRDAVAGRLWQLVRALGGWPAMGGLAAACAAGVWLGVAPPDFLPDPVGLVMQEQGEVNLLDSYQLSTVLLEDGQDDR